MTAVLTFIRLVFLYLIIISGSIFWSDVLRKKTSTTIPIQIMFLMFGTYIFGIFNLLLPGVYIMAALSMGARYIYYIKKSKRKKTNNIFL